MFQAAVDPVVGARFEKREHFASDHHVLGERHWPVLGNDDFRIAADGIEPLAEFLGVGHRCGQADQAYRVIQVQNDFFPHRASVSVGQVVDLVHHDMGEAIQLWRLGVEHVAQYLCRHHHDVGGPIDAGVAGEQAHRIFTVLRDKVVVFLIAQRLNGRGVEAFRAAVQRKRDGKLTDDGLARAGGRAHEHPAVLLHRPAGLELEIVEGKRLGVGEFPQEGSTRFGGKHAP